MDNLSKVLKRKRDAEDRLRRSDPNKNVIISVTDTGLDQSNNPGSALTLAVESLNNLTGDVALAAGTNITISVAGQTITIDVYQDEFGGVTDYSEFEADGTLVMHGAAMVWEDLRVAATSVKLAGVKDPGFAQALTDGAGSTGVYVYWFDAASVEEIFFAVQLPHDWAGTAIHPHVHWIPKTTADGDPTNQAVRWGLEYSWANPGAVFGNTVVVYGAAHSPADANVVANKHYKSSFAAITPSTDQDDISSMMICRLFRDAANAADTYEHDAGLLEFDIHYEINTLGSRTEYTK